jgi:EcsC protein family
MASFNTNNNQSDLIQSTLDWIADAGIYGLGVLPSAQELAEDHLKNKASIEEAINSLIAWRTTHAAGTGFVAGLGGVTAMPVTIPAGLATSYVLGANTAAAVAYLRGYDIRSEKVRTMILLCLIGEAGKEILKSTGITVGVKVFKNVIKQIPGKVLTEINKKVGFRLITKAGEKGVINLMKIVPFFGGLVGGTFDAFFVNSCGQTAKNIFPPS